MKSFETLQKMYEKEIGLSEKHKQNALDIKKEIEMQRNRQSIKKIQALNLSGTEYDRFIHLLDDKESVMSAIELLTKTAGGQPEQTKEVAMNAVLQES